MKKNKQDWHNGMLARIEYNPHAEETVRQTLDRVYPQWRRGLLGLVGISFLLIAVMAFWENYLF